jgi:hypothetical protein
MLFKAFVLDSYPQTQFSSKDQSRRRGKLRPNALFFNLTFPASLFCSLDQKCVLMPAKQQSHAHQKRQHHPDRQLKAVANQKSAALTSARVWGRRAAAFPNSP